MKKKTSYKVIGAIVAALLALLAGGTLYLQWYALEAQGNERGKDLDASYAFMYEHYPFLSHWVDSLQRAEALRDTFIMADDGARLHALYLRADTLTPRTAIVVHGYTMGAATTMNVSGEPQPPFVHCFVEDCGYTSVWDEYKGELRNQFGLPAFPLLHLASWATDLRYGWNFREASPLAQVKKCRLPMLFIHGTEDTLFAAKPGVKEYWRVEGAEHANSYLKFPKEYTERVKTFLEKYNIPKDMNNLPTE